MAAIYLPTTLEVQPIKKADMATSASSNPQTPPRSPPSHTPSLTHNPKVPEILDSYLSPSWFPEMDEVIQRVDQFFLDRWNFPSEKARRKMVAAGFSRVTCMYFPKATSERIDYACKLLTILFLIDDLIEEMSFEEGEAYNNNLMPIMRGDEIPNRDEPAEFIMYDLWQEMRQCDMDLANDILEPVFVFMRAQTDKTRKNIKGLGAYLLYRERDVGKALLSALMRFSMDLRLSSDELVFMKPIDENCAKHISVVNDIFSWEKELLQSQNGHEEGSALCTSVQVLAEEANLTIPAAKRVLFAMCREWELMHLKLVSNVAGNDDLDDVGKARLLRYAYGLGYQMIGNELWSAQTLRYIDPQA